MTEAARQLTTCPCRLRGGADRDCLLGADTSDDKFVVAEVDSFTVGILVTVDAGLICLVVALVIGLSLPKTASAALDGILGLWVLHRLSGALYAWSNGDNNLACGADYRDYARLDGIVCGAYRTPHASPRVVDRIVDWLSSGLPFWSALGSALVAATTRWMATYCVLPLRSAALPNILHGSADV